MHNDIVTNLVKKYNEIKETYFIHEASSCILIENGTFYGIGRVLEPNATSSIEVLKPYLTQYPENEVLKNMIKQFIIKHPEKIHYFQ